MNNKIAKVNAKSVILHRRPVGAASPVLGEDFSILEFPAPLNAPEDGLLVEVVWMSVDPYLRNMMNAQFKVGEALYGFVSGVVLESKNPSFKKGDFFGANLPFTTIQQVTNLSSFLHLSQYLESKDELSLGLGLLGMPGSTAYAGVDLMHVSESDKVWVSACTGAVGYLVGQICKNVKKCPLVIGSCGSKEKCAVAQERFGFDACFDYHAGNVSQQVKQHAPEGIDFYFENVGGNHLVAAVENLNVKGRVAVCGAISGYNSAELSAPVDLGSVIYKQLRIEGFLCGDWRSGKRGNFLHEMHAWYRAGLVTKEETVFEGIEQWPAAFATLFQPGNTHLGKVVVRVG